MSKSLLRAVQNLRVASRHEVFRSILSLMGGTAVAQMVAVSVLPLLTRLYSPADFELLATYIAVLTILSPAACGRYDAAINVPASSETAVGLLALSILVALGSALLIGIAALAFSAEIVSLLGSAPLAPYLWLLPLGVGASGLYLAVQAWATRQRWFGEIARTRATQAVGGVGVQAALGFVSVGPIGLLLGHLVNSSAGVWRLGIRAFRADRRHLSFVNWAVIRRAAAEYRRMPAYSVPEILTNNAGTQLPIIIIASLAAGPEAGFLLLAMRAIGTPISMIGGAAGQVYLGHGAEYYRDGALGPFTRKILVNLARVSVGPLMLIGAVAPSLFGWVFGDEWARAGEMVRWMTAWSIFRLLSSPISMVMHLRMAQRAMLVLTTAGLVLRVGAVIFASVGVGPGLVESYSIASAVFYGLCYLVFSKYADLKLSDHLRIFGASLPLVIVCSAIVVVGVYLSVLEV